MITFPFGLLAQIPFGQTVRPTILDSGNAVFSGPFRLVSVDPTVAGSCQAPDWVQNNSTGQLSYCLPNGTPNGTTSGGNGTWVRFTAAGGVTAANVAAAIQSQSGCSTAGFVWLPQSNTCVAQSGGVLPSGTPNKVVATDPTGAATNVSALRLLVALDIPALNYQAPLGFTAENSANKNVANGYAPLDGTAKIPVANVPVLNQSTTGQAATATALAANGTNCTAGFYPLGVDQFGNSESCTAATSQLVTGTSATSYSIGGGAFTFTTQAGLGYLPGARLRVASRSNLGVQFVEGVVTVYTGTALTINVTYAPFGTGTFSDWNINLTGQNGVDGVSGTGTVTATTGALAAQAIMVGNTLVDSKTPNASTTVDASGNISTPGVITSGAGGTGSGIFSFPGGTQATSVALAPVNSSGFVGPATAPSGKHFLANPIVGATANQFLLYGVEASGISTGVWNTYTQTFTAVSNFWLTGFNAGTGVWTTAQPASTNLSDSPLLARLASPAFSGTVTVANLTVSGTCTGCGAASGGVNPQTTNYTLIASDSGKLVTMTGTSLTASLPATPPSTTWSVSIQNLSPTTNLIVSRGTLLINGGAGNFTLLPYQLIPFFTDGTNYFARPTYQAGTNTTLTTGPSGIQINATGGNTTQNYGIVQGTPTAEAAASTGFYSPYSNGFSTAEIVRQFIPGAGTLKNLTIKTNSSQSVGGSMVCSVRINGTNAAQSITIATSGAAGTFQDTTNTTATLDMDFVSIGCLNNGTAGSAQVTAVYIQHAH